MRFGLIGPLLIVSETGQRQTLGGPRLRALLTALLLTPNVPVPAQTLVESVWDSTPSPAALETLRSYVRRLRRALGPQTGALIQACSPGYLIRLGEGDLDVPVFEALCADAAVARRLGGWTLTASAATRALNLWRGQPLLDVPSRPFHGGIVARLEQLRLQALEDRAEADLHLGRHEQLIPALCDLTFQFPLHERFQAQLMLALYRCGRQADALGCYRNARRQLVEELGVEPGTELQRLHQYVLAGDGGLRDQVQPDAGGEAETTADAARIRRLERENAELRRVNAILRTAGGLSPAVLSQEG
jgi:DNA-binding SARP family transcriptional activator